MKRKKRTMKETKLLRNRIVKHYFNNPDKNGYKHIMSKFKVHESFIREVLSKELENRFKKRQCIRG